MEQEGALHDGANRFVLPPFIAEQQQAAGIDEVIFDSSISILSCSSSLLQNRPWSSAPPSLSGAASPKRDESEFRGLKKATSCEPTEIDGWGLSALGADPILYLISSRRIAQATGCPLLFILGAGRAAAAG